MSFMNNFFGRVMGSNISVPYPRLSPADISHPTPAMGEFHFFEEIGSKSVCISGYERINTIAECINDQPQAYVFCSKTLDTKEMLTIRVEEAKSGFISTLAFGLTNRYPGAINSQHLPQDCSQLRLTRTGYWVFQRNLEQASVGDKLRFQRTQTGTILLSVNGKKAVTLFDIDFAQTQLYPWFCFNGSVTKIKILPKVRGQQDLIAESSVEIIIPSDSDIIANVPPPNITTASNRPPLPPKTRTLPAFHWVKSSNVNISNDSTFAERTNNQPKAYVFSKTPIKPQQSLVIVVNEVDNRYSDSLVVGLTSCLPPLIDPIDLPTDCSDLGKRADEFWVSSKNAARYACQGDRVTIKRTRSGDVELQVNNGTPVYLFKVDWFQDFFLFFNLSGFVTKIEIIENGSFRKNPQSITSNPEIPNRAIPVASTPPPRPLTPAPSPRLQRNRLGSEPALYPLRFFQKTGLDVSLSSDKQVASRTDIFKPYVSIECFFIFGKRIGLEVHEVDSSSTAGLAFGLTNCPFREMSPNEFPQDCMALLDRSEYWVILQNIIISPKVGDKILLDIKRNGEIKVTINEETPTSLFHVDNEQSFHVFFCLNGAVKSIKLLGLQDQGQSSRTTVVPTTTSTIPVSSPSASPLKRATHPPLEIPTPVVTGEKEETKAHYSGQESRDECIICFDKKTNTAPYPCGHQCMCYDCALKQWRKGSGRCPICQQDIKDIIRIYH